MIVMRNRLRFEDARLEVRSNFLPGNVEDLKCGIEYEVHAICVFEGVAVFLIADCDCRVRWAPADFFDLTSASIPDDWHVMLNAESEPRLVLGPGFMTQSRDSYAAMVEGDPESLRQFWARLGRQERPHTE